VEDCERAAGGCKLANKSEKIAAERPCLDTHVVLRLSMLGDCCERVPRDMRKNVVLECKYPCSLQELLIKADDSVSEIVRFFSSSLAD
jgi:hypothetical protein